MEFLVFNDGMLMVSLPSFSSISGTSGLRQEGMQICGSLLLAQSVKVSGIEGMSSKLRIKLSIKDIFFH